MDQNDGQTKLQFDQKSRAVRGKEVIRRGEAFHCVHQISVC